MCSYQLPILKKRHAQIIEKKNTKNVTRILKVCISMMAGQIQLKFRMKSSLPRGSFHSKNDEFPFWHYQQQKKNNQATDG